ncbi:MAG: hypothetical protein A2017_02200 [Lentisphaerae bacterium GWF2_44_16]|nr:MAG: hypothetical protein A2017_02200 [Lentisphaerae bacterium GWF2_44_16]
MITMKDIARHFGISRTTVSLCLSGKAAQYKIAEATEKNVCDYAAKAGFVPDQTAISLVSGKKKAVGIFVNLFTSGKSNDALRHFIGTISRTDIKYQVIHFQENTIFSCIQEMLGNGIKTIIIIGWIEHSDDFLESVKPYLQNGAKLFLVDYYFTDPLIKRRENICFIGIDRKKAYLETFEYLHKLGHRKIAISFNPIRLEAWTEFRKKHSLSFNYIIKPPAPALDTDSGFNDEKEFIDKVIKLYKEEQITAITLSNDFLAARLIDALGRNGIKTPRDISVVGFDNLKFSPYFNVPLTTVDVPVSDMVNKVLEAILNGKKLPSRTVLEANLIIRSSAGKIFTDIKNGHIKENHN